jgi:hypothetical protein
MGDIVKDFSILREFNLLNIPLISFVSGSLLYQHGGLTFPVFSSGLLKTRLLVYKIFLTRIFSCFCVTRFSKKKKKFKKNIRTLKIFF